MGTCTILSVRPIVGWCVASGCSKGNGCCAQIGMPWFYRKLQMKTAENFESRNCKNEASISDEDIAVENMELFVL